MTDHPFWHPLVEFATHAVVGTLIFLIIAVFAVGLDLTVNLLENIPTVSVWIIYGLKTAAGALFATDLCVFGAFLWGAAKKAFSNTGLL